jgi:3D (Asp-Asp-Asp) domain-containing protein
MKNNKLVGLGLALVIIIVGYFILYPGKQPKYLVHRYPFSLDVFKQVSLTTYTTDSNETDSTPLITASGFKLDSLNPKKHRVIAISRDLKELFSFGDKVMLSNAGKYNGIWFIHDLMNKRWRNKIDILINPDDRQMSLKGVVISKI